MYNINNHNVMTIIWSTFKYAGCDLLLSTSSFEANSGQKLCFNMYKCHYKAKRVTIILMIFI